MSGCVPDLTSADTLRTLREIAEGSARAAGRAARDHFRGGFAVRLKPDHSEVCDADEAAQAAAVATIRACRGGDAFITEEPLPNSGEQVRPSDQVLCWVIDPLDGTRNFVRGIPLYACSVAVMRGGYPLAGAVYDPERDALYSASTAEGLLVNGQLQPADAAARVRPARLNPRPLVALPSTPVGPVARLAHEWLDRFICRNLGSTALHLALVATGHLDGMLSDNARLWDLAAGWLLVTVAGGTVASITGEPLFPLNVARYSDQELPIVASSSAQAAQLMEKR